MQATCEAVIDAATQLDEEDILNQSEADFDSLGGCVSVVTGY